MQRYKKYLIYANFWEVEGGKPENPDRPDRCAHPEPCGEESGQLYCPETTKKEKYKEIYANFRGVEGGKPEKPENPDRPDRCAHPEPCGEESGQLYCPETTKKENYQERKQPKRKRKKQPRKKNTKKYANFWGMEGGKLENPDRPDRYAHPEPCGEESGQLYCPETTKKENKGKMSKKRSKGRFYLHMSKKSSKFAA